MKQWQKEIKQAQLDREKQVYKELEGTYRQALDDVNKKAKDLQDQISKLVADDPENESLLRSKVYQLKYQEQIKAQLDDAMNRLNDAGSIEAYMEDMYKEGYASNIYALQKQGVPVIAPINHDKMLTALTYNTNNIPLSTRLYKNVEKTKKQVMSEITRGIASGMSNQDVARNIKNRMGVSYRKARQLAQNEGHRVNTQAVMDSMYDAKDRGADIVKQWDCTYDKKTRPVHARLDQKWTGIDDYFDYGGGKVFAPKQFGVASLDINCRCALLSVPRWDVDSDTPKHLDNITGELIEAKNYDDWKKKYYDISEEYSNVQQSQLRTTNKVVDASNVQGIYKYRDGMYDYQIEDIINYQGYDGLPKVVSSDDFSKAMKESNFYAERTYSANSKEILEEYKNQLRNGSFYVDCSTGGAQYGQGMYCAAIYDVKSKKGIAGIGAEMSHYKMAGEMRGMPYHFTESITLDPSAKIFELPYGKKAEEYINDMYRRKYMLDHASEDLKEKLTEYYRLTDIADTKETYEEYKKIIEQRDLIFKDGNSEMGRLSKESMEATMYKPNDSKYGRPKNAGALVAEMGYDAINAIGHGESGSYTVILNRTKVILCDGGSIYGN